MSLQKNENKTDITKKSQTNKQTKTSIKNSNKSNNVNQKTSFN